MAYTVLCIIIIGLVRGLVWGEVGFSVVKEDRDAEVGEVAVSAGDVLDGLDRGVEALRVCWRSDARTKRGCLVSVRRSTSGPTLSLT